MEISFFRVNSKHKKLNLSFENFTFSIFCFVFMVLFSSSSILIYSTSNQNYTPVKYTICIDAGHGGIDGGATGSFLEESEVNLEISKKLTKLFVAGGFNVVNTREEDICLCDESSPTFKLDDMKKRREIIQKANPSILISIHCNKFNLPSSIGAQVFYQKENSNSQLLAETMTTYFVENLPNARKFPLSGDYYVLNSIANPSVLVECGYLSNPQEEKLLATTEYQNKLAYSIYAGTLKYLFKYV